MNKYCDEQIVNSWHINATPWISAVRDGEIDSRLLVTNKAILEAIVKSGSKSVLDVGCGEGWLARELRQHGVASLGVDVVPELVSAAKAEGGGRFKCMSYDKLSYESLNERFDAVVCNFSLLGEASVVHIFKHVSNLLNETGSLIVQTIHPVAGCGDGEYIDGWREGSWQGFNKNFTKPAPWYFRTMDTWKSLFINNGFKLKEISEPINQITNSPASVLFIGEKQLTR